MSLEENLRVLQALPAQPTREERERKHSEEAVHAAKLRAAEITFDTIMEGFTNGTFSFENEHDRNMYETAVERVRELRSQEVICLHDNILMSEAGPRCIACGAS